MTQSRKQLQQNYVPFFTFESLMSDKLTQEKDLLLEIASRPPIGRALGYLKRSGPGLLQSGMTLGGGSAAASVVAGASFGYKLLWVQPVAMFLGIMMFAALANIVLTTGERPYKGFMRELSVILVFFWALGSVVAAIVWHFPQYGLAAGAVRSIVQEFVPAKPPVDDDVEIKGEWRVVQTRGADGKWIYKRAELQDNWKLVQDERVPERSWFGFGSVVIDDKTGEPKMTTQFTPFGYVVSFCTGLLLLLINITIVFNYGRGGSGIKVYEWFMRGIIALVFLSFMLVVVVNVDKILWIEMLKGFVGWYGIPSHEDPAEYAKTVTMVLGMIGASVGINMTFMYPYSLLKKGWGPEHKTLAKWDLGLTMFMPFAIITSLVMVGMTVSGIYDVNNVNGIRDMVNSGIRPTDAAKALQTDWIPAWGATVIFCSGLFGMACGAIAAHMTCCGFIMCEMFGMEHTKWNFRLFAMTPSIGFFGVVIGLPLWFPIAASAICLTMLPVAYLIFLILNNRRSYIGDAVGKGWKRVVFNTLLVLALLMATIGASVLVKVRVIDVLFPPKVQQIVEEPATDGND